MLSFLKRRRRNNNLQELTSNDIRQRTQTQVTVLSNDSQTQMCLENSPVTFIESEFDVRNTFMVEDSIKSGKDSDLHVILNEKVKDYEALTGTDLSKPDFHKNEERKVNFYTGDQIFSEDTGTIKNYIVKERLHKRRNGMMVTSKDLQLEIAAALRANAIV